MSFNLKLNRMGVLNCTPNSFSDGGEIGSVESFLKKLHGFGPIDALDIGAESTAPMNSSIPWEEEWDRLKIYLPHLKNFNGILSFDTYHPETIEQILKHFRDEAFSQTLFWNDVSGKMDLFVKDFLKNNPRYYYVFCHNLAPLRDLSGRHMDYVDQNLSVEKLANFFLPQRHSRIIFDPCLGFSKTYDQNWLILNHFKKLQELSQHSSWLLGFSRKSFLRKKYNLLLSDRDELDKVHIDILNQISMKGEVWIRTHRPELL